ncbi:MAG: hypothetical protein Harvfovirus18_20 [Harvfovirus sp.]|uniref:Uncharacterized protein n=1 Tax=Harvfovirus sp. TaxID=2487768 RepID=A0A3G5A1T3_9VIRU|nr:MAG: hypothetical protein Harvfovirus18_20 [Harvfovirus sp.]
MAEKCCLIPGCESPRGQIEFAKHFVVEQPFCLKHTRKCKCGEPCITRRYYRSRKDADQKLIDEIDASFATGCLKHERTCRKKECKNERLNVYYHPISEYVPLKVLNHYCPEHVAICKLCGINGCLPLNTKRILFSDRCYDCELKRFSSTILGEEICTAYLCLKSGCHGQRNFVLIGVGKWLLKNFCASCSPKPPKPPALLSMRFTLDLSKMIRYSQGVAVT